MLLSLVLRESRRKAGVVVIGADVDEDLLLRPHVTSCGFVLTVQTMSAAAARGVQTRLIWYLERYGHVVSAIILSFFV